MRSSLLKPEVGLCIRSGCGLLLGSLLATGSAFSQSTSPPIPPHSSLPTDSPGADGSGLSRTPSQTQPVESNIAYEGLVSYGHYKIFASGRSAKLYFAGIEYDRHSWGYFLRARMDYVAEFMPVVLLNAAAKYDYWGNPKSTARTLIPGIGFAPIGFRMVWRDGKAWKPYITAKGGMLIFSQKAMSQDATYENFSLQSAAGMLTRLTPRVDLRLGLWGDFHFSNGFMVPVNPGLDCMNTTFGISYRLGGQSPTR